VTVIILMVCPAISHSGTLLSHQGLAGCGSRPVSVGMHCGLGNSRHEIGGRSISAASSEAWELGGCPRTNDVDQEGEARGRQKSPWLAGTMSFFLPGAGQFYNGETAKGLLHFGVFTTALCVGGLTAGDGYREGRRSGETEALLGASLVVVVSSLVWSIWDAQSTAKRINAVGRSDRASGTVLDCGPMAIRLDTEHGCLEAKTIVAIKF